MKVAVLSPVWFSVPPTRYGGIEAIVALQADGLVRAGVDVTLFASGDSTSSAELVSVFDVAPSERIGDPMVELEHVLACVRESGRFDVVHDHSGLIALAVIGQLGVPLVHTTHGPLTGESARFYAAVCDSIPSVGLVSLSRNQRLPAPDLPWIANVPNAIDTSRFQVEREPTDTLAFLGRMSDEKGAREAIQVARACGRPLRIAAKCREPAEQEYFDTFVAPELDDQIEYVGELGHDDKVELLRTAHCLLFPINWEEPFGLVMIEAMACGTPVVATRRGSVPEVVTHGVTGFVAKNAEELPHFVELASSLDADEIRADVARRFSVDRMVHRYRRTYDQMLATDREPVSVPLRVAG